MTITNKNVMQKIFLAVLLTVTCVSLVLTLSACGKQTPSAEKETARIPLYNDTGSSQKAIIILPGILGSNLVSADSGKALWSAGSLISNIAMNPDMLDSEGRFSVDAFDGYLGQFLFHDGNGDVKTAVRAANMKDADLEYGLLNSYQSLYTLFNTSFGPDTSYGYQVKVFQYDWTQSCKKSAEDLDVFITKNKYTDVVLVGHSMGGLVIDNYLASLTSFDNVKEVITLGTPHYGAVDSACFALGGIMPAAGSLVSEEELSSIFAELDGKLPEGVDNIVDFGLLITGSLQKLTRTLPSAYDLFPIDALAEATSSDTFTLNGYSATTAEIAAEMEKKEWVSGNANISSIANNLSVSSPLFINGVFVADKVKTYYIAGSGVSTTLTATFVADDADFHFAGMTSTKDGDSLVLISSATAGHSVEDGNVYVIDGVNHLDLIKAYDNGTMTDVGKKLVAAAKNALN